MQQIPLILVKSLVPLLLKQIDSLNALASTIPSKLAGIVSSKTIKCNDPRVTSLKKDLENISKLISGINSSLSGLTKILNALTTIGRLARLFKLVGLAIPTTVPGPVSVIVTKFSDTGINCLSAVDSLRNLVGYAQVELQKVSVVLANALNVVGSICNDEYFNTDIETKKQMNSLSNLNLGTDVKLSSVNSNVNNGGIFGYGGLFGFGDISNDTSDKRFKGDSEGIYINNGFMNKTYISDFYNEHNVSDNDINNALDLLNDLYEQQKIELSNILSDQKNLSFKDKLIFNQVKRTDLGTPEQRALLLYREAPSDVYFGKSISYGTNEMLFPSLTGNENDIFVGGKPDDFFVDIDSKLIFGPKESNTSWGQPIKY